MRICVANMVCFEIFEFKSKIRHNGISNIFSKKCYAIEIFEFWLKLAIVLEGTSFKVLWYKGTGFILDHLKQTGSSQCMAINELIIFARKILLQTNIFSKFDLLLLK